MAADPDIRPVRTDDDVARVRAFLRSAFQADGGRSGVWHVARFDYLQWHVCPNVAQVALADVAWMVEASGEVVALLAADGGPGEAHLSIAPAARSVSLEAKALDVAEATLAGSDAAPDGAPGEWRRLVVWASAGDHARTALLEQRGYRRSDVAERRWRGDVRREAAVPPLPEGYRVRPLGRGLDLLERCFASGLAFHDDVRVAVENRDDPTWYHSIQRAPLYRRDLDLVAEAPDGAIAGFVTVWFDDVTRSAYLEPVGVVPAHRRRGVARALLTAARAAAHRAGATDAYVGGFDEAANALYGAALGDGVEVIEAWLRRW